MSQTVNRLADRDHLVRTRDPDDGRRVLSVLTDLGAAAADASRRHRENWLSDRLDALSAAERYTLSEACRILRDIAES